MNQKLLVLALSTTLLAGCSQTTVPSPVIIDTGSNISGDVQPPLTNILPGPANEYTLLFSGTRTENLTVYHKNGEHTKVFFINSDAKKMKVKVSFPDNMMGNLRRSQIIMPDGQADGPFGTDTEYNLTQFGWYQLIFNENMMSWDPRSGDAQITITLQ